MTHVQHIPFYIHRFKEFPWRKYESRHYIFNVEADSLAEKDIDSIRLRQEATYKKIIETLSLQESSQNIFYYFYSSREKKAQLMGDDWYGQSVYDEFTIHAVYNEEDKVVGEHEDTHLLTLQLGYPVSFFQEGIAEAMVGKSMFGNSHNEIIRSGLRRKLEIDLKSLISTQQAWLDTPDEEAEFYYSIAGSFINYLLKNFDLERFKQLYFLNTRDNPKEKNLEIFKDIIGTDIDTIEKQWRKTEINIQ